MRAKSLRTKSLAILGAVMLLATILNFGVLNYLVFPSFVELEQAEASQNLNRTRDAIQNELSHLTRFVWDWAAWDDTNEYIRNPSQEYVDSNLVESVFTGNNLNLILFYNSKGNLVWGQAYDLVLKKRIALKEIPSIYLPPTHSLLKHSKVTSAPKGVIITNRGPLLIASRPIVTSEEKGPMRGTIVMGRFLSGPVIEALKKQTQVEFHIWPLDKRPGSSVDQKALMELEAGKKIVLRETGDGFVAAYSLLLDYENKAAVLLRANTPRNISAMGIRTLEVALLGVLATGLISLIVIVVLQGRLIIGPLVRLTDHVLAIGSSGDLSKRLSFKRTDEIGTLALEFDQMLDNLAAARRRQLEQSYHSLLENSPIGLAVTSHTPSSDRIVARRLFVNNTLVEMFGFSSAEALMEADIADSWVDQDQLQYSNEIMKGGGELIDFEVLRRRVDGSELWISMNTRPIQFDGQDCTMVWHFDITKRKKAEDDLHESAARLQLVADSVPGSISFFDRDGRYLFANKSAEAWFGRPRAEIVGKTLPEVLGGNTYETLLPHIQRALSGNHVSFEETITYPDRVQRVVEITFTPHVGNDGHVQGLFGLAIDVTDRKQTEEELRQSHKMQAIGTLAGGIAHDLNNTLVPVLALTEFTLEELPEGSRERTNLEHVRDAALRARGLVQQILAFSRRDEPKRKPVELHAIVEEALQLMDATLPTTIEIRRDIDEAIGLVCADVTQLHQVMMNLCSNAAQAMDGMIGELGVTLGRVDLEKGHLFEASGLAPGPYALLTVSDTGSGMDGETVERIFDPFFTTRAVGKGTGLGLAMVHGIITSHGGTIRVDSEPGQGTTFQVYLPLLPEGAEAAPNKDDDEN